MNNRLVFVVPPPLINAPHADTHGWLLGSKKRFTINPALLGNSSAIRFAFWLPRSIRRARTAVLNEQHRSSRR